MSLEGQQIGRYRFLRQLGSGGMGEVYLAEDARIGQQVAIKVIRTEIGPYPNSDAATEAARLFEREAKAIAKLDHPHILALFDYGEEHLQNMTLTYMVMPYRQEGSLADWLRSRNNARLLSPQDVAHFVNQAAEALQHAHDHQIVHQDVKPSNFLIRSRKEAPNRPDLLLADFGVARLTSGTSSASQSVRGTPTYMAPEQWEADAVPASDQYALAIMAYELLTGQPPFQGGLGRMMYQHLNVPPTPPSVLNPRLSKEIDTVLLHALAKRPQERFASVTAFANAFQQAVQGMQAADAPTFLSPATVPPFGRPASTPVNNDDLKAVLAISAAEARTGTSRTLTLPDGRRVEVQIPAGMQDGQTLRLEGQGTLSRADGVAGALILTIVVKGVEEVPFSSNPGMATVGSPAIVPNEASTQPPVETHAPTVNNTSNQPTEGGSRPGLVSQRPIPNPVTPILPLISSPEGVWPAQVQPQGQQPMVLGGVGAGQQNSLGVHQPRPAKPTLPIADAVGAFARTELGPAVQPSERIAPPPKRKSHLALIITLLLLIVALTVGGIYAAPWIGGLFPKTPTPTTVPPDPGPATSATVTITPLSMDLKQTFNNITAVTGTPDPAQSQVAAHQLSVNTPDHAQTVAATGSTTTGGTSATGTLTFANDDPTAPLTLPAGTQITNDNSPAITMVLDADLNVAAASGSTAGMGTAPAHVLEVGTIGNIGNSSGSGSFNHCVPGTSSCSTTVGSGWHTNNVGAFTGGQDPQTVPVVKQSDIDGAAHSLEQANMPDPRSVLQGQIQSNERLVGSSHCTPNVTSDHHAGDQAAMVIVTVNFTCTGESYDHDGALALATQLLKNQASSNPGSEYGLVGQIQTTLNTSSVTDPAQGTVTVTVTAEGIWVFQFGDAQKQQLAMLLTGRKQSDAQALLANQKGVGKASIQLSGGDGVTFPTDVSKITIAVQ